MAGLISSVSGWLGFGEEAETPAPRPSQGTTERAPSVAKITQLHKRRPSADQPNEIFSIEPDSYLGSGEEIASYYREGVTVIVNMAKLSEAEALRMVDFLSGLKLALLGNIKRITKHVYLLTPVHVGINDPEPAEEVVDGLLVRP
jgi:cell division inhibitor SepF